MTIFISELRNAHEVLVCHRRGIITAQEIAQRAHMNVTEVRFWLRAFNLPVASLQRAHTNFPVRAQADFKTLNNEGA